MKLNYLIIKIFMGLLTMFSKTKKDNEQKKIEKDIYLQLKESFKADYLVLSRKILRVNEDLFLKKLSENLGETIYITHKNKGVLSNIDNEIDRIFWKVLDVSFLNAFLHITYINDHDYKWVNELLETASENGENSKSKKGEKGLFNLKEKLQLLKNYKLYNIEISNRVFFLNDIDTTYAFIYEGNIDLNTLREIAFKIDKKYEIIVLPSTIYNTEREKIQFFLNNKINGLNDVSNSYLKYYLVNSLINKDMGDFNLTYYFGQNEIHLNSSIRIKGKYKFFEIDGENDVDVNYIESDILALGGKLSGIITYTKITVGKAEYRVLIIRKEELYFLNIRPFTNGFYFKEEGLIEEILEKAGIDITPFIIDFESKNQIYYSQDKLAKLDHRKKFKHANINFPLAYRQKTIDTLIKKIIVPRTSGLFFINGPVGSGKSVSLMNALKYYIDYNVEHHSENKNVLLIENPIEMFSSYLKQIQVDDEDIEDYKDILMALKRSDTDLVSIGELRNKELFGVVSEIAMSQPVITTFHVSNVRSFLALIYDYADKNGLNYKDVFSRINFSVCQLLLEIENVSDEDINLGTYSYKENENAVLLNEFVGKLGLDKTHIEGNKKLKNVIVEIINLLWKHKKYPLKMSGKNTRKKVIEEFISSDDISNFLENGGDIDNLDRIYEFSGYDNSILYQTLMLFAEGKMLVTSLKFEEISLSNKIEIFKKVLSDLKQIYEQKPI